MSATTITGTAEHTTASPPVQANTYQMPLGQSIGKILVIIGTIGIIASPFIGMGSGIVGLYTLGGSFAAFLIGGIVYSSYQP